MINREVMSLDSFRKFCSYHDVGFTIDALSKDSTYDIKIHSFDGPVYSEDNVHVHDLKGFVDRWIEHVHRQNQNEFVHQMSKIKR